MASAEFSEQKRPKPFRRILGEQHNPAEVLPIGIFASPHVRLARGIAVSGSHFNNRVPENLGPEEKRIVVNIHGAETVLPYVEVAAAEIRELAPGSEGADQGELYRETIIQERNKFFAKKDSEQKTHDQNS